MPAPSAKASYFMVNPVDGGEVSPTICHPFFDTCGCSVACLSSGSGERDARPASPASEALPTHGPSTSGVPPGLRRRPPSPCSKSSSASRPFPSRGPRGRTGRRWTGSPATARRWGWASVRSAPCRASPSCWPLGRAKSRRRSGRRPLHRCTGPRLRKGLGTAVGGGGRGQGCVRREGTSEAAPGAVRQAVGGGCRSGWGAVTVGYKCHRGWHLPSRGQLPGGYLPPPPPFQSVPDRGGGWGSGNGLSCSSRRRSVGSDTRCVLCPTAAPVQWTTRPRRPVPRADRRHRRVQRRGAAGVTCLSVR